LAKVVPDEVSINGKEVNPVQSHQGPVKLVPEEVSINGKDVRLLF